MTDLNFYKNKRVLITGHTGFKGTWLCKILADLGTDVFGYALESPTKPSLFEITHMGSKVHSIIGDICDLDHLQRVFREVQPELVIHMAAQPLVRESYERPVYTYQTNVMGTVNVLECIRNTASVNSFLNVTTDKVYRNEEWNRGYVETDVLDGYDPYSNSKSCSELVTHSYSNSFLSKQGVAVSTCRAGNVIGGGDFAKDRIIPDCIRAAIDGQDIVVRNPNSTRPYQHVLEPLFAYLLISMSQYKNIKYAGCYNIGPEDLSCITTGELATLFCNKWGEGLRWCCHSDAGPHEANFLKLDCAKIKTSFDWKPKWNVEYAVEKVIEWEKCYRNGGNVEECMRRQIGEYNGRVIL